MTQTLRAPLLLTLVVVFSLVGVRAVWELTPTESTSASAMRREALVLASSAEDLTAALEERQAQLHEAASRKRQADERARKVWPAKGGLTGWWGEPRTGRLHYGIDVDGDSGDPIYAIAMGTVVHAGPAPQGYGGYGNMVLIDHGGYTSLYAHLDRVDVKLGIPVVAGQIIGLMGTTGAVTGSHLHFETRMNGNPVDPAWFLPPR